MRAALGASRGRIARALLSESVVLALAGGAARRGARAGGHRVAANDRACGAAACRRHRHRLDGAAVHVVRLGAERSLCSACLPSSDSGSRASRRSKREAGRPATLPARHRTRDALVVGQVALALTLLIVSGLMIRTFVAMRQVDPGFTRPEEVQTFVIAIPARPHRRSTAGGAHVRERRRTTGAGARRHLRWSLVLHHDGRRRQRQLRSRSRSSPIRKGRWSSSGGSRASRRDTSRRWAIRLVAGRSITWSDIHEQRPVIIISEPLAREYWGEPAKAIGKRVRGSSPRFAVARNRRRVRQRARRWADAAADADRLLADAE